MPTTTRTRPLLCGEARLRWPLHPVLLVLVALIGLGLAPRPAVAAALDLAEVDDSLLQPPELPTEVELGVYLVGINRISPVSEAFPAMEAEFSITAAWEDPRLAHDGAVPKVFHGHQVEVLFDQVWWPELHLENEEGKRTIEERDLRITSAGRVEYEERFAATVHLDLDLRKFPFDRQAIDVVFGSFTWDQRFVRLKVLESRTGFDTHFKTLEWELEGVTAGVTSHPEIRSEHPFSILTLTIDLVRDPGFYLWKLVMPLLIIAALAWTTFWMSGEPASPRMQRTFIIILSLVAFHRVIASSLPHISYLTFMDGCVYLVFLFSGATIVQVMLVHRAEQAKDLPRAQRLDRRARWLFPGLFILCLVLLWILAH